MVVLTKQDMHFSCDAITHAGVFHADEVLGSVILERALGDVRIARVNEVSKNCKDDAVVFDIGYGEFDHHQPGGNGARDNGIPYASAGLLWKHFGPSIVERSSDPQWLWSYVDETLIQGVDAWDNGTVSLVGDMSKAYTFSRMIAGFNPEWDSSESSDDAFLLAVNFARQVFDNVFKHGVALLSSRQFVEEAVESSSDGIMKLNKPLPWKDALFTSKNEKASKILFVVYPSDRGGYCWQAVQDRPGSLTQRVNAPSKWWGLSGKELQDATGVSDAIFCHRTGFTGSAESLEGAIAIAKIAIASDR